MDSAADTMRRYEERISQLKSEIEQSLERPVPVPTKAQLDAMSYFRYGVPYDELPD